MNFKDIADLVKNINQDLGYEFCNEFQYKRKELTGSARTAGNDELFGNINTEEGWAINKGGGTEIQYHIEFNKSGFEIYYGLGFNTQYVPFKNEMSMVEYMKPFMKAFLELKSRIDKGLPDYSYIYGDDELMRTPQENKYVLYGKSFSIVENDTDYTIEDHRYKELLSDLNHQFSPYIQIFELRNKLITMNNKMENFIELLKIKPQIILQGPPGTGKTYTAKDIAESILYGNVSTDKNEQKDRLEKSEKLLQFKLIQFHPAYSYEDFVRGITAKPHGDFIEYKSENKVLGKIAAEASKNFRDSKKNSDILSREQWLNDMLEEFKDSIQDTLGREGKYVFPGAAHIYDIDDTAFRYTGDNWGTKFRMPFSDLLNLYNLGINERREIKNHPEISGRAKQHATYYFNLLQKFKEFLSGKAYLASDDTTVIEKKYILIIDEINRANLPAVLGELIYGLEYRGEKVESMYDINGDFSLILPPNLYIIGTMNTADRSAGHIDYALRRRFAFVDIPPSEEVIKEVVPIENGLRDKALKLYADVAMFFTTEKMAADFKVKDIQLGHSYFLAKTENELALKLKYEIKPLLKEYIKDGILLSVKNEKDEDETELEIDNLKIS